MYRGDIMQCEDCSIGSILMKMVMKKSKVNEGFSTQSLIREAEDRFVP